MLVYLCHHRMLQNVMLSMYLCFGPRLELHNKQFSLLLCSEMQVVHIDKPHGDQVPELPVAAVNYHRDIAGGERPWRTDIKPLNVVQPEGPSFLVMPPSFVHLKLSV